MANESGTHPELDYADTLWKAADALRGQVDAAEYKHVVLGLLFLKYISDSFEARREQLQAELEADGIAGPQLERLLENRDEYTAERVFWVPPEARWQNPQNQAARADIARLIDDAIIHRLAPPSGHGGGKPGFVLTPGRYVGAEEVEDDGEPFAEKYPRLLADPACFGESERLMAVVRERLKGVGEAG